MAAGNKTSSAPGHFTEALLEELLRTQNTTELGTRLGERMRRTTTEVYSEGPEGAPFELYQRAKTALPRNERVPTYDDNAALVDELGRDAFAEVIAMRIEEAYEGVTKDPNRNGAIMVHLHGRWGSGKSSVLNFLKRKLTDEGKGPEDAEKITEKDWIVVEFNAWQHQRMPTPWWPLLRTIYKRSASDASTGTWWRWNWRHFKMRWAQPVALVAFLLAGGVVMWDRGVDDLDMKIASGVLGLVGAAAALLKAPTLFSSKAGQELDEMRVNKHDLIKKFFEDIVSTTSRPIIVFIDDLDRCKSDYVVELLEGVQTLFKGAPIAYVVASDRDWIRKSFEEGYKDFAGTIGAPGRPLGHLFLEKMFQMSVGIPRIGVDEREAYWNKLLKPMEPDEREALLVERRRAREKADEEVLDAISMEEINTKVETAKNAGDHAQAQALSEAGAVHIASALVHEATEHRLMRFAELLEPNPRAMKRLVNAYGMNQASLLLERRKVDPDALARWTILEMRWPLFAEALAQQPDRVVDVFKGVDLAIQGLTPETVALARHQNVKDVVGVVEQDIPGQLTPERIREIVGSSVAAEQLAAKEPASPPQAASPAAPTPPPAL
ncbi:MAG: hypothetical protein KA175_04785 [Flavobacteriales bacterium]|nr:hypothetical protein [Flavobacteriales bacterium]MBP6696911.1 hypothetical protein [Flavobacteriales bacterium]